jgi:hypothetical protein
VSDNKCLMKILGPERGYINFHAQNLVPLFLNISLEKRQCFLTDSIPQTDIPALLYRWVKTTSFVKMLSTKKFMSLYLRKNTCLMVGLLKIGHVFPIPVKLHIGGLRLIAVL